MGDSGKPDETPTGADGVAERNPAVPASEEGTGIVPEDEEKPARGTHLPASEADTELVEEEAEDSPPKWPGRGEPGTTPPPD